MNIRAKLLASAIAALIPVSAMAGQRLSVVPGIKIQIGGAEVSTEIAQADMPSSGQIQRKLEGQPRIEIEPEDRVTVREFKRRPELRRAAPSIDIQAINFAFASADIPYSQYGKVENIAIALENLLSKRPNAKILIEGHTDAVGSNRTNLRLSERRAASLKWTLVQEFGIPPYALETVGYGEDYLLVPTSYENWQNRRVTLRRFDQFVQ